MTEEPAAAEELISEVERQFSILIRQARHSLQRRSAELHPGLMTVGYKVATVLSREEPLTQGQLVEELGSDKATISRAVKQLEEFAIVARSPAPQDRRAALLHLTADGRERVLASTAPERQLLHSKLVSWDTEALQDFIALLSRLNQTERACQDDGVSRPDQESAGEGAP
ncbi:MAG: MarR family winged helix-turn-helix transcriptional regulator [Propionibacteriaceae bacterium]